MKKYIITESMDTNQLIIRYLKKSKFGETVTIGMAINRETSNIISSTRHIRKMMERTVKLRIKNDNIFKFFIRKLKIVLAI